MEAANNVDDLLVRYLLNESDHSEKLFVEDWINAKEENREHFEQLKKTVNLLALQGINTIDIDKEWHHLQGLIAAGSRTIAGSTFEDDACAAPEAEEMVPQNRRKKIYRRLFTTAAAAAIIIFIAANWLFNNKAGTGQVAMADSGSSVKINPANAIAHHEFNNSGRTRAFALPDGSQVRLSANSELTYSEPADKHERNIMLKGEADFAVAKDKTKPFTVFSGDISTRAVGTRFTVTAFETDKFIQVKLEEGKVLVKSEKTTDKKLTDNFYLLPGQQLVYDKNQQTAKIKSFGRNDKTVAGNNSQQYNDDGTNDNLLLPQYNKKSWFMFNNQSLPEIFHALELMYDVKIDYARKDVEQRYFIGTFSKSDSVENILHQIAVLNKLVVTRKDNAFFISKAR